MLTVDVFSFFSDDSKDSAIEDDHWLLETVRGFPGQRSASPSSDEPGTIRIKPRNMGHLHRDDVFDEPPELDRKLPITKESRQSPPARDVSPASKRPISIPPVTRLPDDMPPPLPAKQRNSSLKVCRCSNYFFSIVNSISSLNSPHCTSLSQQPFIL